MCNYSDIHMQKRVFSVHDTVTVPAIHNLFIHTNEQIIHVTVTRVEYQSTC